MAADGAKGEPAGGEGRRIAKGKDFFAVAPELRDTAAGNDADVIGLVRFEQKFFVTEIVLRQQRARHRATVAAKAGGRVRVAAIPDIISEQRIVVGEFSRAR